MSTATATTRAPSQPLEALQVANRVRVERQRLKREVAALPPAESRARAAELILEPPDALRTMLLVDLLSACQQIGGFRAERIMQRAQASPVKQLKALTVRQRLALAGELRSIG